MLLRIFCFGLMIVLGFNTYAQKTGSFSHFVHPIDSKKSIASFNPGKISNDPSEAILRQFIERSVINVGNSYNVGVELVHTTTSLMANHYRFIQTYKAKEIFRSEVKVNVKFSGEVLSLFQLTYDVNDLEIDNNFPTENLIEQLILQEGFDSSKYDLVYFPSGNSLVGAVAIEGVREDAYWQAVYDANQNLLYRRDLNTYAFPQDSTVNGMVFMPDPLTTAEKEYGIPYVDSNNGDVSSLNAERVAVDIPVTYDNGVFKLIGPYAQILEFSAPTVSPATSTTNSFAFTRSESGFEDFSAFYHIHAYQEYIQSLGFNNLANYRIHVDAHGHQGVENSSFSAATNPPRLTFGDFGVDDAEDADVIIHEYGHAISYSAAPGTNNGLERQSIDEGLGDFLAASHSKSINEFNYGKVFNWDGHNEFWPGRSAVSSKTYPNDLISSIHLDAEIWSSVLMDINVEIGRELSEKICFQSLYSYASNMDMKQAATVYLQAEEFLTNGANAAAICTQFKNRGILDDSCFPVTTVNNSSALNVKSVVVADKQLIIDFVNNEIDKNYVISIVDIAGRIVANKKLNTLERAVLSTQNWSKGIYFVQIQPALGKSENFKVFVN